MVAGCWFGMDWWGGFTNTMIVLDLCSNTLCSNVVCYERFDVGIIYFFYRLFVCAARLALVDIFGIPVGGCSGWWFGCHVLWWVWVGILYCGCARVIICFIFAFSWFYYFILSFGVIFLLDPKHHHFLALISIPSFLSFLVAHGGLTPFLFRLMKRLY